MTAFFSTIFGLAFFSGAFFLSKGPSSSFFFSSSFIPAFTFLSSSGFFYISSFLSSSFLGWTLTTAFEAVVAPLMGELDLEEFYFINK